MTVAISPAHFSSNNASRIEDLSPKTQEFETFASSLRCASLAAQARSSSALIAIRDCREYKRLNPRPVPSIR